MIFEAQDSLSKSWTYQEESWGGLVAAAPVQEASWSFMLAPSAPVQEASSSMLAPLAPVQEASFQFHVGSYTIERQPKKLSVIIYLSLFNLRVQSSSLSIEAFK